VLEQGVGAYSLLGGPQATTGRLLVSFRPEAHEYVPKLLSEVGVAAVSTADQEPSEARVRPSDHGALYLHALGIAVIEPRPEQAVLEQRLIRDSAVLRVSFERLVAAQEDFGSFERGPSNADALIAQVVAGMSRIESIVDTALGGTGRQRWDQSDLTWGLQAIGVSSDSPTGEGVRVAILDGGVDVGHPDFEGRVSEQLSFISRPDAGPINAGHGTHCAGIIAGAERPAVGPRYGVAPEVEVLSARVLDARLLGADGDVLAGLNWAVASGCSVASLSFAGRATHEAKGAFEDGVKVAVSKGTLVVAAAGNGALRRVRLYGRVGYPAACPSAIAVGAVDPRLDPARFSPRSSHDAQITLAAPGIGVLSAWAGGVRTTNICDGTSCAAPFVVGALACVASAMPTADTDVVVQELRARVQRLGSTDSRDVGWGLVSLGTAPSGP